ncbi:MAG: hypothetical protein PVI94_19745, partial [Desulfobacterales bacterium]
SALHFVVRRFFSHYNITSFWVYANVLFEFKYFQSRREPKKFITEWVYKTAVIIIMTIELQQHEGSCPFIHKLS